MTLVTYEPKHYPFMLMWWNERSFPAIAEEYLPEIGLVVLEDDAPICVGFLYETGNQTCFMDHLVSDPKADLTHRDQGLDFLILALAQIAETKGYGMVGGASNRPRLIERFTRLGFVTYDKDVVHLGKKLGR